MSAEPTKLFPTMHRADGCTLDVEEHDGTLHLVISFGDDRRSLQIDRASAELFWQTRAEPHAVALAIEKMAGEMTERSP